MSKPAKAQAHHPSGSRTHGAGVLREEEHDPYRARGHLADATTCPDCHAQVRQGRWQWVSAPTASQVAAPIGPLQRCPACERLHARDPAAWVTLRGHYVQAHRDALLALIRHEEQRQVAEHPLERIMAVEDAADGSTVVSTTGLHLARAIGHALERAFHGELRQHYADGQMRLRVVWTRD